MISREAARSRLFGAREDRGNPNEVDSTMENFSTLLGRTIESVTGGVDDDRMIFETVDGPSFALYHTRDCCEHVSIHDIVGDIADLIGSPILFAEESESEDPPADVRRDYDPESETWTFYRLGTIKGSVVIRWHGTSNGYYSERVYFEQC